MIAAAFSRLMKSSGNPTLALPLQGRARVGSLLVVITISLTSITHIATACPSCYGGAEGATIDGMNNAITAMLIILGLVASMIGAFFYRLYKRSATSHTR